MKRTGKKGGKKADSTMGVLEKAAKPATVSREAQKRLPGRLRSASNRRMSSGIEITRPPELEANADLAEVHGAAQRYLLGALQALQALETRPSKRGNLVHNIQHLVQMCLALLSEDDASREPLGLEPERLAEFAATLRYRRKGAGLSREKLAELAGISPRTIYNVETARQAPSRVTLCRLLAVPSLRMHVSDFSRDITTDPAWSPNSWFAPRYDPSQLMADMLHLLNGPGGQLEQTYLYIEPQSANDYMQLCNSTPVFLSFRLHSPLEQVGAQVAKRFNGAGVDVIALGSGDGQGEVRLVQALASSRGPRPDIRLYLLDISHTLLSVAHKHAMSTLSPGSVDVYALHANFHDIARYPVLHATSAKQRRRLYLLLGNTIANLDNEIRFFQDLASCAAPDDLCVIELQLALAPPERPDEIRRLERPLAPDYQPPHEDWLLGPIERHCQGAMMCHMTVDLTVHCPVPGSYELNFIAQVRLQGGVERRFMTHRVKRYDAERLAKCLDGLGWACLSTLRYGASGDKTAAVMVLRRK
jgi:transcriptional regulator with XRE-family HTH domain